MNSPGAITHANQYLHIEEDLHGRQFLIGLKISTKSLALNNPCLAENRNTILNYSTTNIALRSNDESKSIPSSEPPKVTKELVLIGIEKLIHSLNPNAETNQPETIALDKIIRLIGIENIYHKWEKIKFNASDKSIKNLDKIPNEFNEFLGEFTDKSRMDSLKMTIRPNAPEDSLENFLSDRKLMAQFFGLATADR